VLVVDLPRPGVKDTEGTDDGAVRRLEGGPGIEAGACSDFGRVDLDELISGLGSWQRVVGAGPLAFDFDAVLWGAGSEAEVAGA
jgi:hypothetical protein